MLFICIITAVTLVGCNSSNEPIPQYYVGLDRSFNAPLGYALFNPGPEFTSRGVETALQSDGRIIVLGSTVNGMDDDLLLVRYTREGQVDTSFGTNGSVRYGDYDRDRGLGLAIMPADNSIIVAGYITVQGSRELLVVKFTADGRFVRDLLYSDLGTDIGFGITVTPDQKIVVIGESSSSLSKKQDLLLLQMDSNLQLDPDFGLQGVVHYNGSANENEKGFAVAAQPDGKLVACGAVVVSGKEDMLVLRLKQDGSLDTSFAANGSFIWSSPADRADYANNLALQPDGRIVVAGAAGTADGYRIVTLRLHSDGTLDNSFGQGGVLSFTGLTGSYAYPYGVAVQPDGRIVLAGSSTGSTGGKHAVVLRSTADGLWDVTFGAGGVMVFDSSTGGDTVANGLTLQPDQAILVTGYHSSGQSDHVLTYRLK